MFRNAYDTDVTTWSPQGRLLQVEYAMEAVNQGSACLGLKSKDYAIVASIKRSASELASHQEKVFKIDEHMGMAISGLIADARVLTKYLRNECLSHKYTYESSMPVQRLSIQLADKSQVFTQKAEKRPYGVGMLIIGYDKTGAQLFQNVPSGNYFSYHAQAMGARSQSARTYLEKHYESFADEQSLDALIDHALNALKTTLAGDDKMNVENVSLAVVGKGMAFKHYSPDDIRPFVERAAADDDDAATAMEE